MTEVQVLFGDPKSREFGLALAEEVARVAAGKKHRLAPYLVDGRHVLTLGQAERIMRHLKGCPDLSVVKEEDMGRARTRAEAEAARPSDHIADIAAGFYATPSRTGANDLDFWKVHVTGKGFRKVKRVVGGGDEKHPRLLDISNQEGGAALSAIIRTGIRKAGEDYADNQQRCMRCGLHLTDEDSRAARMGPVCREK